MAYSFIQAASGHSGGYNTSIAKAFTSNVTAGSKLVAFISVGTDAGSTVASVTDSLGNTWTKIDDGAAEFQRGEAWETIAGSSGACTVTATYTSGYHDGQIIISEHGGLASEAYDQKSEVVESSYLNSHPVSATPTLSQADELALFFYAGDSNSTYSLGSGWTGLVNQNASDLYGSAAMQRKTVSSTAGVSGSIDSGTYMKGYGIIVTFKIAASASPPTVTTQAVSSIGQTTATGNGNVTSDGGAAITERGVCWNTGGTPTTANSKATSAGTTGAFTASMTGLSASTTYYVRAYAINSQGTSYGSQVSFTTNAPPATLEQEGFAFGDDDGSQSAHTLDTQDTNITEALGTKTLRMLINATNDPASKAYKLKYQKNGTGGYLDVPTDAAGAGARGEITFVGSAESSGFNGTNITLDLSGIGLQEGDFVLVAYGVGSNTNRDLTASGWTEIADLYVNNSYDTNLAVFWKIMAATPDSSIALDGAGGTSESTTAIAMAFRGVDQTTPFPATPTTAQGVSTYTADPPSISHGGDAENIVVGVWASGNNKGAAGTFDSPPTGYETNFATIAADDTYDISLAMGYNLAPSNPENPGSASPTGSNSTGFTWATFTIALQGAETAGANNEVYISPSSNVAAGGEATTARLTAPSGKTTADFDTGRRWDDENGTDSIDITADDYTELEWVLTTQSPAATDDYFDFRVYDGDAALDTYTVTPRWTIGAGDTISEAGKVAWANISQAGTVTKANIAAIGGVTT